MRKLLFIFMTTLSLVSCTQQKETENKAETLYAEAEKAYADGNYNRSKLLIDSIHATYRMDVEVRKKALNLMHEINAREEERTHEYLMSIKPRRVAEFDSLLKFFAVSSDSEYFNYTKYVHKSQNSSTPRISLVAEVKDNGEMQIISVYMGNKLDHKRVRVQNKDNMFVETEEISLDSPYNNRFDDFGTRWEYITFTSGNYGSVPTFVAENADKQLKVTLIADSVDTKNQKKAVTYSYWLDPQDRKAIKQALELSQVASDLYKINKELE